MSDEGHRIFELRRDPYLVSTDRALLDLEVIHGFLAGAYWCEGIPFETVARAIAHSLPFGAYQEGRQIGFARVISDFSTFAYLADVFVLEEHRGNGVGKLLMECVTGHPDLQGLRTQLLLTRDAHGLYRQFGFEVTSRPERVMVKQNPGIYRERGSR
jgi:GNAT superfamily N-acetyltransferase